MGQWTPMDSPMPPVPWYSGLDRQWDKPGQRVGCPVDIPWTPLDR